jgi:DNA-binding HxlR family transcriptional regulator
MKGDGEAHPDLKREKACMIRNGNKQICIDPSIEMLKMIGRKYTLLIIGVVGNNEGKANFNEILKDIPGSSSTIISKRLKEMVNIGLISKNVKNGRVSYSLTDFGIKLRGSMIPLFKFMEEISVV